MIRDRRGEGGFMEAIVAFSAVIVALTIFLGLLAYTDLGDSDGLNELNTGFIKDLAIDDGRICNYDGTELCRFVERNGLNGAELKVSVAGDLSDASLDESVGTRDGNNIDTLTGTFRIHADDGRTFVASYEVVYWWD